jgi:hypothetical protein
MIDCRGKIDGDVVRLQVHRDICGHQSQRGRTAGRNPHSDPLEIGKPGEIEGSVPQEELVEEESEQEQVSGFRDRNADGKRPKLAEEVQGSRTSASLKVRNLLGKVWARTASRNRAKICTSCKFPLVSFNPSAESTIPIVILSRLIFNLIEIS